MSQATTTTSSEDGPVATAPAAVASASAPVAARTRSDRLSTAAAVVCVATGLAALVAYALWLGRGLTIYSDEWDIFAFHHDGHYFVPYNGHLSLVPVAIYRLLFAITGVGSSLPYRAAGLVCYVALAFTFFAYARRRVGPAGAALLCLALAWSSAAQMNVMYGFLLNFSIPMIAAFVIWALFDRGGRFDDGIGAVALGVALASSSIGLAVAAAVIVELAARRAAPKRWLPYLVPIALWLGWYVHYREPLSRQPAGAIGRYAGRQVLGTFAAFTGSWKPGGWIVLLGFIVLVGFAVLRWRSWSVRATGAAGGWVGFVALTAIARAGDTMLNPPDASRYCWIGSLFVLVIIAECLRGRRLMPVVFGIAAALIVMNGVVLVGHLRQYRDQVVAYDQDIRAPLGAVEAMGGRADPNQVLPLNLIPVRVKDYLAAVRHIGSPDPPISMATAGSAAGRRGADGLLVKDLPVALRPIPTSTGACRGAADPGDLTIARGSDVVVRAGSTAATVSVRRFSRSFVLPPMGTVRAGDDALLHIPADGSSVPWHVRVSGVGAVVSSCP